MKLSILVFGLFGSLVFASSLRSSLEKVHEILSSRIKKNTLALPLPLRFRMEADPLLNQELKFSFKILNACVEYLETPVLLHTRESKSAFIKKILLFAEEEESKDFMTTSAHPIYHDAFKTLGEAMSPAQCLKFESYSKLFFVVHMQLFLTLKDYSWVSKDTIEIIASTSLLRHVDLFSVQDSAFAKTAPVEVLAVAVTAYYCNSRSFDVLEERLFKNPQLVSFLSLYPVLTYLPADKRNLPFNYDCDNSLLIANLKTNGLTTANLPVLLAYAQVTDALIFRNLSAIADGWLEATLNWEFEDVQAKIDIFYEQAAINFDTIIALRDSRFELLNVFNNFETCERAIVEKFPEWKEMILNQLKNPVNGLLRSVLQNLSNLELHPVILVEDSASIIPLPRAHQTERIESVPLPQRRDPMLWNALVRNVFFVNGEDWKNQVPAEFNWADRQEIKAHLRQEWQFIYDHSQEVLITPAQLIFDRLQFFKFLCRFDISSKNYLLEFAEIITGNEKLENVYFEFLGTIPPELFDVHELEYLEVIFRSSKNLRKLIDGLMLVISGDSDFISKRDFYFKSNVFAVSLDFFTKADTLIKAGDIKKGVYIAFCSMMRTYSAEALIFMCGSNVQTKSFRKLLSDKSFADFFNYYGRLFTPSQVAALLACEEGRQFLKRNKAGAKKLTDYSTFTKEHLEEIGLNIEDIEINLSTLPYDLKLSALNASDPVRFAVCLGTKFWLEKRTMAELNAWTMLNPLILYVLDSGWSEVTQIQSLVNEIPEKIGKVSLEDAIKLITKWLVQQEWNFLVYHVLVQTFGKEKEILKRLYIGYRTLLTAEVLARQHFAKWIDEIQFVSFRPEIVNNLQLICQCLNRPLFNLRRKHLLAVVYEISLDSLITVIDDKVFRASNPYGTVTEITHIFSSTLPLKQEELTLLKTILKGETLWLAKFEAVQQFDCESVTGSLLDAYKLLHRLPTTDALIYKMALELMKIDTSAIIAKSVPFFDVERKQVLLEAGVVSFPISFGSYNGRMFEPVSDAELIAYKAKVAKEEASLKKKSSKRKKPKLNKTIANNKN